MQNSQGNTRIIPGILPPDTAREMMRLALDALQDPAIVEVAKRIVLHVAPDYEGAKASALSEATAIYNFVQSRIRYTKDPERVELIYTVPKIKQMWEKHGRWSGDCDDMALVTLTLTMAIGLKTRLSIASFPRQQGTQWYYPYEFYSHVFVENFIPALGWRVNDPSLGPKVWHMAKKAIQVMHFYPSGQVETFRLKEPPPGVIVI